MLSQPFKLDVRSAGDCGKGLFTQQEIEEGFIIGILHGTLLSKEAAEQRADDKYMFDVNGRHVDAKFAKNCILKFANHRCQV